MDAVFFIVFCFVSFVAIYSVHSQFSNDFPLCNERIFSCFIFCPCHYVFSRCDWPSLVINPIWFWNIRSVSFSNLLEASKDRISTFFLAKWLENELWIAVLEHFSDILNKSKHFSLKLPFFSYFARNEDFHWKIMSFYQKTSFFRFLSKYYICW